MRIGNNFQSETGSFSINTNDGLISSNSKIQLSGQFTLQPFSEVEAPVMKFGEHTDISTYDNAVFIGHSLKNLRLHFGDNSSIKHSQLSVNVYDLILGNNVSFIRVNDLYHSTFNITNNFFTGSNVNFSNTRLTLTAKTINAFINISLGEITAESLSGHITGQITLHGVVNQETDQIYPTEIIGGTRDIPVLEPYGLAFEEGIFLLSPFSIKIADLSSLYYYDEGVEIRGIKSATPHIFGLSTKAGKERWQALYPSVRLELQSDPGTDPITGNTLVVISDAPNSQTLGVANGYIQYADTSAEQINISINWLTNWLKNNSKSSLTVTAANNLTLVDNLLLVLGNLILSAQKDILLDGAITAGTGSFAAVSNAGDITINGGIDAMGNAALSFEAKRGNINTNAHIAYGNQAASFTAKNMRLGSDVLVAGDSRLDVVAETLALSNNALLASSKGALAIAASKSVTANAGSQLEGKSVEIFADNIALQGATVTGTDSVTLAGSGSQSSSRLPAASVSLLRQSGKNTTVSGGNGGVYIASNALTFDANSPVTTISSSGTVILARANTANAIAIPGGTTTKPVIKAGTIAFDGTGEFTLAPYAIQAKNVVMPLSTITLTGTQSGSREAHIFGIAQSWFGSETPETWENNTAWRNKSVLLASADGRVWPTKGTDPSTGNILVVISDAANSQELAFVNGQIQYADASASKITISAAWLADELNSASSPLIVTATEMLTIASSLSFASGQLNLTAGGDVALNAEVFSANGLFSIVSAGTITVSNNICTKSATLEADNIVMDNGAKIQTKAFALTANDFEMQRGTGISSGGKVDLFSDTVFIEGGSIGGDFVTLSGRHTSTAKELVMNDNGSIRAGDTLRLHVQKLDMGNSSGLKGSDVYVAAYRAGNNTYGAAEKIYMDHSASIIGDDVYLFTDMLEMNNSSHITTERSDGRASSLAIAGSGRVDQSMLNTYQFSPAAKISMNNSSRINGWDFVSLFTDELDMNTSATIDDVQILHIGGSGRQTTNAMYIDTPSASVNLLSRNSAIKSVEVFNLYTNGFVFNSSALDTPIDVKTISIATDSTLIFPEGATRKRPWIKAEKVNFEQGNMELWPYAIQASNVEWKTSGVNLTGKPVLLLHGPQPHIFGITSFEHLDKWPFVTVFLENITGDITVSSAQIAELQKVVNEYIATERMIDYYGDVIIDEQNYFYYLSIWHSYISEMRVQKEKAVAEIEEIRTALTDLLEYVDESTAWKIVSFLNDLDSLGQTLWETLDMPDGFLGTVGAAKDVLESIDLTFRAVATLFFGTMEQQQAMNEEIFDKAVKLLLTPMTTFYSVAWGIIDIGNIFNKKLGLPPVEPGIGNWTLPRLDEINFGGWVPQPTIGS